MNMKDLRLKKKYKIIYDKHKIIYNKHKIISDTISVQYRKLKKIEINIFKFSKKIRLIKQEVLGASPDYLKSLAFNFEVQRRIKSGMTHWPYNQGKPVFAFPNWYHFTQWIIPYLNTFTNLYNNIIININNIIIISKSLPFFKLLISLNNKINHISIDNKFKINISLLIFRLFLFSLMLLILYLIFLLSLYSLYTIKDILVILYVFIYKVIMLINKYLLLNIKIKYVIGLGIYSIYSFMLYMIYIVIKFFINIEKILFSWMLKNLSNLPSLNIYSNLYLYSILLPNILGYIGFNNIILLIIMTLFFFIHFIFNQDMYKSIQKVNLLILYLFILIYLNYLINTNDYYFIGSIFFSIYLSGLSNYYIKE